MIYKVKAGQQIKVSASEIKKTIMKVNRWSAKTYNKKRYLFKNKLRTYEAFTKSKTAQSPVELLYKQALAKKREGRNYHPSLKMKRIMKLTAYGNKGRISYGLARPKKALELNEAFSRATRAKFGNFIAANPGAQKIWDEVTDPVKREQALADYADAVHAKMAADEKIVAGSAIPFGDVAGTPDVVDFDLTPYM